MAGNVQPRRGADASDDIPDEQLHAALAQTPRGAFAVAGVMTALLMAAWAFVYLFIFLPRGPVG
jgi:hypothetical protein